MKVLVTGANGMLGSALAIALTSRGHSVVGADFVQPRIPGVKCVGGDMRDYDTCISLGKGMDVVAHIGAYHGVHLLTHGGPKTEKDFFDANIAGTFNMFRCAVENKVPGVVWASSCVVYERDFWEIFGIYSLSKVLGEEMAQYFNRIHHLKMIGLRYGTFDSNVDLLTRGFGMLGGFGHGNWIELEEVVKVTVAAVEDERINFGIYDVQTPLPISPTDEWTYLRGKRLEVVKKYWPKHARLLEKYADRLPVRINTVDVNRTIRDLNWRVERDFSWFLDELQRREAAGEPVDTP